MAELALFDDGSRWAHLSDDGLYRYELGRRWAEGPLLGFVMLNPSTGDADRDDPTLRRCMSFARREDAAGILVLNLFAYRTPKPAEMRKAARNGIDIIGPHNDEWLQRLADDRFGVKRVIGAWGSAGQGGYTWNTTVLFPRIFLLRRLLGTRLHRFADPRTMTEYPHPRYLPDTTPIEQHSRTEGATS